MNQTPSPVSAALAAFANSGSFSTRGTASARELPLAIRGVGRIPLPVTASVARALIRSARPARYGRGAQTLLDRAVRDSWEIPGASIDLDRDGWEPTLRRQLARAGRALGLPEDRPLRAELHNLLVYEPGQFFVGHQDSEKADGMIATLVAVLPSPHEGGELVVEHRGERRTFRGDAEKITFIAFYADCRHELRPVRAGFRVALTWNLVLEPGSTSGRREVPPPSSITPLIGALKSHFEGPAGSEAGTDLQQGRGGGAASFAPPDRLVYLLDHQYTQRGLKWPQLKSADAVRAEALRVAGKALGCEVHLTQVEVHETWDCEDEGYRGWGRRRWADEDDEAPSSGDHPRLLELIDTEVELLGFEAGGERFVRAAERCQTRESGAFEPHRSQHEGYMGNYGNTVDRWYRRAAVVLWPRERAFLLKAKASQAWAVRELWKRVAAGSAEEAREEARRLLPFWQRAPRGEPSGDFVQTLLQLAAGLEDAELAGALLAALELEELGARNAPGLSAVAARYGLAWSEALLKAWSGARRRGGERWEPWLARLPALCRGLMRGGAGAPSSFARALVAVQLAAVKDTLEDPSRQFMGTYELERLRRLRKPVLALLESAEIVREGGLRAEVLALFESEAAPQAWRLALLRDAAVRWSAAERRALGLEPLVTRGCETLRALLAAPPRAPDDFSITPPRGCACALCQQLAGFLGARDQQRLEWPLAKDRRAHVHGIIDRLGLPLTHQTVHVGSPHRLVLTKTAALFERAAKERAQWREDLRLLGERSGA